MAGKYSQSERLEIGRRIFEGELSRYEAAVRYGISDYTARDYFRMYKAAQKEAMPDAPESDYRGMSRDELIEELKFARKKIDELSRAD